MFSWRDMKDTLRELEDPEVKNAFQTVVIDTVDIAGGYCEKYICNQNGVTRINEIPYGQGWNLLKKEFETTCRKIAQMGYALFFISHDKDKEFTMRDGTKYNQVVPTCPTSLNEIAKDMADIYAYAEKYSDNGLAKVRLILRSLDNSVDTGCRFKYIEPVIEMEYSALVKALNSAIDKEAALNNNEFVTDEREQITEVKNLDYDALMSEFNTMVKTLLEKDAERYSPRITFIVEKYFGVGKKISEATMAQVDFVYLVVTEIREELYSKL